ncbi:hypothetical protein RHGRI_013302 [Rhododendron griersonianum]|uniref:Uncharacterized protein n=1 Tax=Rhododendron griersonianum TaxID=479676 RepID=A0AAV6K5C4_9ERIC|nr:hypothetical protein RHGRI_013302 [Rhododendron griersonianum]
MASSPLRSKSNYHTHSVSLPSRLHPVITPVDEHLRLSGLEKMYDRLGDLLQLPQTRQAFAQQRLEKWVEVVLENYLRLMDVCATVKDLSAQTKQDLQGLLSILRRRREADDFSEYLNSRKQAKKVIQKSLKDLKSIKTKHAAVALGKRRELLDLLNVVEATTIWVVESLLSFISGTKAESRLSAFSLASKLLQRKSIASEDEETKSNMFEKFDAALHSFNNQKTSKSDNAVHVENVQTQLGKMESSIEDIEEGLECLFRRRREADDFSGYLNSRKKAKKVIQKSLKDLKSIKTKHAIRGRGKSQELLDSLNEVEAATIGVLESFLSYISGTKADSRLSAFSLASKLVHRKSVASEDEETKSGVFENFDAALHSLNNHKMSKSENGVHFENLQH